MTFESLLASIRKKNFARVYFLTGEEPYYIDQLSAALEEHVLSEEEKEFNQTLLYGKDTDLGTILGAAKRYPMMAPYHFVLVKEAQELKGLFPKRAQEDEAASETAEKSSAQAETLIAYLKNPQPQTVLVFCVKGRNIPARSKLGKAIAEGSHMLFVSEKIRDYQVHAWISTYVQSLKRRIQDRAAMLLAEYLGNDLQKIVNEVGKLLLNLKPEEEITTSHIEKFIGISKDFNVFELQDALAARDHAKAFRIALYFGANLKANPPQLTLGSLFGYYTRMVKYHSLPDKSKGEVAKALGVHPFVADSYARAARNITLPRSIQALSVLHEYDLKLKGVDSGEAGPGELLKEMIARLLN